MTDVKHWLDDLGLSQYARAFVDHSIDLDVLSDLSEQDLKTLGVAPDHCIRASARDRCAFRGRRELWLPMPWRSRKPHRCPTGVARPSAGN